MLWVPTTSFICFTYFKKMDETFLVILNSLLPTKFTARDSTTIIKWLINIEPNGSRI